MVHIAAVYDKMGDLQESTSSQTGNQVRFMDVPLLSSECGPHQVKLWGDAISALTELDNLLAG
jgi:hypothetical protein